MGRGNGLGHGAGRTGERPSLPTGERPSLPTGERPALPTSERGQSRTTTRTAMPAATFADAMTPAEAPPKEGAPGGGKRLATAAETLVMPKVEVPEPPVMTRGGKTKEMPVLRDGKGQTPGDPSTTGKDGRTLGNMSSPIDRGGTRILRMPDPGGKDRADGEETVSGGREGPEGKGLRRGGRSLEPRATAKAPEKDNFGATTTSTTNQRVALRQSQVKKPVLPIRDLIPASLNSLKDLLSVAKRFASDMPLLHQQIRPSDLPPTDRALRAWAFFTAYAEAATAHPATPEGQEVFDKALTKEGFGEYRDARTGKDGVKSAKWVLESANPEQARERAGQVEIEPPPEVMVSETEAAARKESAQPPEAKKAEQPQEAARKQEPAQQPTEGRKLEDAPKAVPQELKDSTFTQQGAERAPLERVAGQAEAFRVNPQLADGQKPVMQQVTPQQRREDEESLVGRADDAWKKLSGGMKLGRNMLWNVLHRMRGGKEDSAIEKEKWNQIAFAAILSFVGLMLLVILVVSL
jgi:hypothetical protein